MNKAVPLWLLVVLVLIALLPAMYLLGVQQGRKQPGHEVVRSSPVSPGAAMPMNHPSLNPRQPPASPQPANLARKGAEKFAHFRVGNRNVKSLYSDGEVVWVGTSGGVIRYHAARDEYKIFDVNNKSLLSNGVFHLNKIGDKLLVGTYGGGLSVYDSKNDSWRNINIPQGLADQFVYDSERLDNGDLWIATWSGVNLVAGARLDDPKAWKTYNKDNTRGGLPNDWVYGVEVDSQGALWFATEAGVARFYNNQWRSWNQKDGVGADYAVVKDDLKFTSDPATESKHHARQKQDQGFSRFKGAYNPNYVVSLEVTGNIVWAGTWGGGLARYDGANWKSFTSKDGLPSNHVFTVFQAPDGVLWVGTSHGLAKYADGKFEIYNKQHGLFADNVFSLVMSDDGTLWAGSFGGVARLQGLNNGK